MWYAMAKRIGATDQMNAGEIVVESLAGMNNSLAAQKIAAHFAHISNQYEPINHA